MKILTKGIIDDLITIKNQEKLSLRQIADQMNTSHSLVSHVVSKRREPTVNFIEKTLVFLSQHLPQKPNEK